MATANACPGPKILRQKTGDQKKLALGWRTSAVRHDPVPKRNEEREGCRENQVRCAGGRTADAVEKLYGPQDVPAIESLKAPERHSKCTADDDGSEYETHSMGSQAA